MQYNEGVLFYSRAPLLSKKMAPAECSYEIYNK